MDALAIVAEEEALLARAKEAIVRASRAAAQRRGPADLRSVEALRELRDEALTASDDDLPSVLHEMSVRQRLLERESSLEALPDPASPYVAHLRVREGGVSKDYALGHVTFVDPESDVRIVDWRVAPVAQIFYRYREGEEYEESFPGRVAEGTVDARRLLVISGGVLVRIVAGGRVLERSADGEWTDRAASTLAPGGARTAVRPGALGVGAGTASRTPEIDVTALLDAEQYAAVAAPPEEALCVLGSAGSGKTTVALHRLARVTTVAPHRFPASRSEVLVPEEGLARLTRRLLAPFGRAAVRVRTSDEWAVSFAREVFRTRIRVRDDPPFTVSALKRHPATFDAVRERLGANGHKGASFGRIRRRLAELFSDRTFLERIVDAAGGQLPHRAVADTVRHTMLQLAEPLEKELESIVDSERKEAIDARPIWEGTPDEWADTLDVEDLPILLAARAWAGQFPPPSIAHAVLDEAEDMSLFELFAFGERIESPRSVTLAGDEAQEVGSAHAGWDRALAALGARDASIVRLAVSYRCPLPVVELAHRLLPEAARTPERAAAAREGAPVGTFGFPDEGQAYLFAAGAVTDLLEREPEASIAVLLHDAEVARAFFELLASHPDARLVVDGAFSFRPGIDVADVDSTKGLEFDYVVVPDATAAAYPDALDARRRLYVAATRACHQLWIVWGGPASPILR